MLLPANQVIDGLQDRLKALNLVMNIWIYSFEKVGHGLLGDSGLIETAVDLVVEEYLNHHKVKLKAFDRPFDACRWYLDLLNETSFLDSGQVELEKDDESRIRIRVREGCPFVVSCRLAHRDGEGSWVCKRALTLGAVIRYATGMEHGYTLLEAGAKGCSLVMFPQRRKKTRLFTRDQVARLLAIFTREVQSVMPGLVERAGKSYAKSLEGDLQEGLKYFAQNGLGRLELVRLDNETGRAVFAGDGLLQGGAEVSEYAVDSFAKGFLTGLVERLSGVKVNCEEITCAARGDDRCTFLVDAARREDVAVLRKLSQVTVSVGYMASFHHLAVPAAGEILAGKRQDVHLRAVKYTSWQDLIKDFLSGKIDGTVLNAPTSMYLREKGMPLKVVALAHRNGTGLVLRSDLAFQRPEEMFAAPLLIATPCLHSTHSVLLYLWLKEKGVDYFKAVKTISVPPAQMLDNLEYGEIDGYIGPEPYLSEAEDRKSGVVVASSAGIWPGHICCVLALNEEFINKYPAEVAVLVDCLYCAGERLEKEPAWGVSLAVKHFGVPRELARRCLAAGERRAGYRELALRQEDFEQMYRYLTEMGGSFRYSYAHLLKTIK